jgi:hypothetical protein
MVVTAALNGARVCGDFAACRTCVPQYLADDQQTREAIAATTWILDGFPCLRSGEPTCRNLARPWPFGRLPGSISDLATKRVPSPRSLSLRLLQWQHVRPALIRWGPAVILIRECI